MLKIFRKIQDIEIKLKNKIGNNYTYILFFIVVISFYYLGYIIGKIIFQ